MALLALIKDDQDIHGQNGYINSIRNKITEQPISDITDHQGNQYIDLVLEGGVVWGLALIGYTYTLEQAGVRFLNLAGTSAGAINAIVLAALGQSSDKKSEELLAIFNKMDLKKFVDGGVLAQELATDIEQKDHPFFAMFPKLLGLLTLGKFSKNKLGINPGQYFENWLEGILNRNNASTTAKLFKKLENKNLKIREITTRKYPVIDQIRFENSFKKNKLAIIASDITTESKIIFPQMGYLYWKNPLDIHPKYYVRASMSIPLFFEPVRINKIPENREEFWQVLTGFEGSLPEVAYLVDGGVISNFPIDVFHSRDCIPLCPTFGIKLDMSRKKASTIDSISDYLTALVKTTIHTHDYTFLLNNDDYKQLISYIDTSQKYVSNHKNKSNNMVKKILEKFKPTESDTFNILDFNMSDEKKAALFALGAKAAYEFICGNEVYASSNKQKPYPSNTIPPFNWEEYKNLREQLIVADTQAYQEKKEKIKKFSLLP
ncbi:hypothetical protein B9T29_02575 [Acinetobacter sp. ANC 3903]|uniref:patatin-like phospholipase family protein n=1 Tax=Acinetobacter sp. ANC 3903 TaxID=1977883 RepID=UPI000A35924E|nr:patatin-like phospholipase family protein [Acinetobacter sp. ANC 3903]OTG63614.1 hypothetical protein B9T29_02575 [Acinetobacter sp. ANC 3903]